MSKKIVITFLLGSLAMTGLSAQGWGGGNRGFGGGWGPGGCWGFGGGYGEFGWIWMIVRSAVTLAVVIVAIFFISRALKNGGVSRLNSGDGAERIIKERYARGEIDEEKMKAMLRELE